MGRRGEREGGETGVEGRSKMERRGREGVKRKYLVVDSSHY